VKLTIEDRLDIQDVVVRYGHAVDDRNWAEFERIFTHDAVVDFRSTDTPPTGLAPIIGLTEIVHQFRDVLLHPLQHIIANNIIVEGSEDRAVSHAKALFPIPGGFVLEGLYRDALVQTPDGWRIENKSISTFDRTGSEWARLNLEGMRARGAVVL
jgi:hypothetical protein